MRDEMNEVQFQILDAVYFVESFDNIFEEVGEPKPVLIDELRNLIDKGWLQVMEYSSAQSDYVRTAIFDTDNLDQYYFLATKEGLLKHNGH